MGVRIVKRRYAFEIENIPYEADYVKVAYSSRYPPIEYT